MDSSQQLLEAMQPWLRLLGSVTEIHGSRVVYALKNDHTTTDQRVFEALELLALLREIDDNARKRGIYTLWSGEASLLSLMEKADRLVCELRVGPGEESTHIDKWLKRVIVSRSGEDDSPGYMKLRRRLEAVYAYRAQDTRSYQLKPVPRGQLVVPIAIELVGPPPGDTLRTFVRILTAHHATWITSESKSVEYKPLLRVQWVSPIHARDRCLSAQVMRSLIQLVDCGVFLENLRICGVDMRGNEVEHVTKGLQRLMGCSKKIEHARNRPEHERGRYVHVAGLLNRRAIAALYSALLTSQTVTSVYLPDALRWATGRDARRHLWHWIAYALFSRHATHRIERGTIPEDIPMQDIEFINELLQHPNPLALLWGNANTATFPATAEVVTASRFLLSPPPANLTDQPEHGYFLSRQQVRVLSSSSSSQQEGYESVLLPGFGRAWVQQNDIDERFLRCSDSWSSPKTLGFSNLVHERAGAVLALLKLVGHRVTKLIFLSHACEPREPIDTWLLEVLACCPVLERFSLCFVCLETVDTFAKVFEMGLCRVQELHADGLRVLDASDAPALFLKTLGS